MTQTVDNRPTIFEPSSPHFFTTSAENSCGREINYSKLLWFVSELPEKDISNEVVQCR
jgi:hypothetical protein